MFARLAVSVSLAALAVPIVPFTASAAGDTGSAVTVPAPNAGDQATITVSKTKDLVNESVRVSWTGFKPSSGTILANGGGTYDVNTENPVRVYECRGADPASSSDCYGSGGFPGIDATDTDPAIPAVPGFTYPGQTDPNDTRPDGPSNFQDTVTASDGTGQVVIQIFTTREAPSLGCDDKDPCSIVVVPNYGRSGNAGDTEDRMDAPWAWANRTVVPLSFAPVGAACPFSGDALSVEGSPAAARLLQSWRVGACSSTTAPVNVDYTAIGEDQTRQDVAAGQSQVGLTSRPLSTSETTTQHLGYAPVTVSSLVVAFQVDDANGQPVRAMNLNARLLAKLVTGSYRVGGDPNTLNNPANLFNDPEFLKLNPGVKWPVGSLGNHPILLADLSDLTWTLTRWINADKDARAFLDGKPDPWGMHVNAAYKGIKLPVDTFPVLDQSQSATFQPIQGLDQVARQLSLAQFPGGVSTQVGGQTVVSKFPAQNPGRREVIGIIDSADAASFLLPTASLQNTGGAFVGPTTAGMSAAIAHFHTDSNGVTGAVDLTSTDRAIYPLTMVTDAVVPLKAPTKSEAAATANLLAYAAGPGQVPGVTLGQLPVGYLPLTKNLLAQNATARKWVLARNGGPAVPSSDGKGSGNTGATGSKTSPTTGSDTPGVAPPTGTTTDAATPTLPAAPATAPVVATSDQALAGVTSSVPAAVVVPLLIVVSGAFCVAGSFALTWHRRPALFAWRWR